MLCRDLPLTRALFVIDSLRRHSEDQINRGRYKLSEQSRHRKICQLSRRVSPNLLTGELSCVYYPKSPLGDIHRAETHAPVPSGYDSRMLSPSPLVLPSPATESPHVPPLLPSLMSLDACLHKPPRPSVRHGAEIDDRNALSLSLQSYSLQPAFASIPAIQGPHDVDDGHCGELDWAADYETECDEEDDKVEYDSALLGAKRAKLSVASAIMRSKSSPSSPVSAPRDLPKVCCHINFAHPDTDGHNLAIRG